MVQKELAILVSVFVLLLLTAIVVVLFVVFVRRKNKLLLEQAAIKRKFDAALAKAQIEIREATLKNISWELHDNIGQLMTLAKIYAQESIQNQEKTQDAINILDRGIKELRALSRSINPRVINEMSLIEAVQIEIERFNRLEYIEAHLEIVGTVQEIDAKEEIIIFRILQEIFANTIKHSKGRNLWVKVQYQKDLLEIQIKDDGIGFDMNEETEGIGLKNIIDRSKILGIGLQYYSKRDEGTQFNLLYSLVS